MEKLKINTMSGSMLEKPVVTAFKSNGGEYVVLDNEMNGTMGLPIILVSKLVNNALTLIPDSEWNAVKEALRLIISGNQVDYIVLGDAINAEDVFFKQLTLPVASFEALKNSYKPVSNNGGNSVESQIVEPQVQVAPQQVVENVMTEPQVMSSVNPGTVGTPVMESQVASPVEMANPMPNVNVVPEAPIMPSAPVQSQSVAEVEPYTEPIAPMPSVEPIPEEHDDVPVDFTADKEAFLKACENMFDALVAKFNNK